LKRTMRIAQAQKVRVAPRGCAGRGLKLLSIIFDTGLFTVAPRGCAGRGLKLKPACRQRNQPSVAPRGCAGRGLKPKTVAVAII